MSFIRKIINWYFCVSDYEVEERARMAKKIHEAKRRHPSMRVVGRGTLCVDKEDIINSESWKESKRKAARYFENKNDGG